MAVRIRVSNFTSAIRQLFSGGKSPQKLRHPIAYDRGEPSFFPLPPKILTDLTLPLPNLPGSENAAGLAFHVVGDTGGLNGAATQIALAKAMASQIEQARQSGETAPAFLYILGDVVYNHGLSSMYLAQFYEPYAVYPAPIFAIPGNHDGDFRGALLFEPSLYGFVCNFCDSTPRPAYPSRPTMTQPYVYWTLACPFATIVGLYSNVDEGSLDPPGAGEQEDWFIEQLQSAPTDKALLVAVHHPPYSFDSVHGGSPGIGNAIDRAMQTAGRLPDAVLSGHVHSYQRFERTCAGKTIPYIVAGAGGFANSDTALHKLQERGKLEVPFQTALPDLTMENFNEDDPGFLRVTVDANRLSIEYFVVPFADHADPAPRLFDSIQYEVGRNAAVSILGT